MARKSKPETQEAAASEAANVKDQISKADAPLTEAEKANPVQTAVAKRLRAARKRLGKVAALAAAEKEGKELNTDQLETLKSKDGLLAVIDELEKITPLLKEAAAAEVSLGIAAAEAKTKAKAERRAEREREAAVAAGGETADADKEAGPATPPQEGKQEAEASPASAPASDAAAASPSTDGVSRLLNLLYFSQLFSSPSDYLQQMERNSCLSYDALSNEANALSEADLDLIGKFGSLLLKRQPGKTISHSEALEECKGLAESWLSQPDSSLPNIIASGTTVADLTAKLERIMKSDYFTIQPIQQVPEGEDSAPMGGSSEGEYRGLAVSQAEAVLEPQLPSVQPQQHVSGLDLHASLQPPQVLSADAGLPEALGAGDGGLGGLQQQGHGHQQLPAQFYGSGIYSGAAAYHPGATAAFQAAAYEAPQVPAINFMNSSNLGMDVGAEPFSAPQAQPQQAPQQPQAPQQQQAPQQPPAEQQQAPQQGQQASGQGQLAANGFPQPQQQQPQQQQSGGQQSGGLNAGDAEVPAPQQPGRGGRGGDRGGRRGGRGYGGRGRFGGDAGQQQQWGAPGTGRGGYSRGARGEGGRGGYRGGRNEAGSRGRGPSGANLNGNQQQQQAPPQAQQ